MEDFNYDYGVCNHEDCDFKSSEIGDLKVFKSKYLGDDYVNCFCLKHYEEKIAEEDEQIKGFIKSNIAPIAEIIKPEFVNQYIINITYTSNIISPITENKINITENNTTNNFIQPDNEISRKIQEMEMMLNQLKHQIIPTAVPIKKPEIKRERKWKPNEDVDVIDKLIEEDEKRQLEEKKREYEKWKRINDEVNLENKKKKSIREEQKQYIKDTYGEIRTDKDDIERIKKIFKDCKCPTIMDVINNNKIIPIQCEKCEIFKAFPDQFINDKNKWNASICAECIKQKTKIVMNCRENKEALCECGMTYYYSSERAKELHKQSLQHKKRMMKKKQIIDIDLLKKEDLYKICRVNLNPDRTYKVSGFKAMPKLELLEKLKQIPDLIIPDDIKI